MFNEATHAAQRAGLQSSLDAAMHDASAVTQEQAAVVEAQAKLVAKWRLGVG